MRRNLWIKLHTRTPVSGYTIIKFNISLSPCALPYCLIFASSKSRSIQLYSFLNIKLICTGGSGPARCSLTNLFSCSLLTIPVCLDKKSSVPAAGHQYWGSISYCDSGTPTGNSESVTLTAELFPHTSSKNISIFPRLQGG